MDGWCVRCHEPLYVSGVPGRMVHAGGSGWCAAGVGDIGPWGPAVVLQAGVLVVQDEREGVR